MSFNVPMFSTGDWIVHRQYGIGQIENKEEKSISGCCEEYYKIKTPDSIIWLPVNKVDKSWFRPIVTQAEIKEALELFKQPPNRMDSNFMKRKERIQKVQSENRIPAIACLIRDLMARQSQKALSDTEKRALTHLVERFIAEWSVCSGRDQDSLHEELNLMLSSIRYRQRPQ